MEPTFNSQPPRSCGRAGAIALALTVVPALGCGETTVSITDRWTSAAGTGGASAAGTGGGGTGPVDACPEDPNSTNPCPCGVGAPTVDLCLLHHYPFDGTGTTVTDVVGGSRPTIEGDRLTLTANGGRALVYRRATD